MKGVVEIEEETGFNIGALITVLLSIIILVSAIWTPSFGKNVEAKADQIAAMLKLDISEMADAERIEIVRYMEGVYDIEITRDKIKVKAYSDDKSVASESEVDYVGDVVLQGKDAVRLDKISSIKLTKDERGILIEEGDTSEFCDEGYADSVVGNAIRESSEKYHVEEALVKAVIASESSFDHCSGDWIHESSSGAKGFMQLIDSTAAGYNVDSADPYENVDGGVHHLADNLNEFAEYGDRIKLAVARYNCGAITRMVNKYCEGMQTCWDQIRDKLGPGKTDKACERVDPKDITTSETVVYVDKVMCYYDYYSNHPELYSMAPIRC